MREKFEFWMKTKEGKKQNTAYAYANSIDKISRHYSKNTKNNIDIYREKNFSIIEKISADYSIRGRFAQFGNEGNGTIRNAIATYVRFLKRQNLGKELSSTEGLSEQETLPDETDINEDEIKSGNYNFTYERDLKNSLINQTNLLFPGFVIYGSNREGVEFSIEGKRIDLLLENTADQSLLAVELKSGEADFRVFGQISMYLGLFSKRFPERTAKGVIIAGEIDETLLNACLTTEKITLKTYQMQLTLIDV